MICIMHSSGSSVKLQTCLPSPFVAFAFQLSAVGTDLPDSGYVYFKFEPFVLHVMCRTLQDAQTLVRTRGLKRECSCGVRVGLPCESVIVLL